MSDVTRLDALARLRDEHDLKHRIAGIRYSFGVSELQKYSD